MSKTRFLNERKDKMEETNRNTVEAGELEIPLGTGMTDVDYLNTKTEDIGFPGVLLRGDYTITHYEESYPDDNGDIAARFTNGQQNLRNAIGAVEHYQSEIFGIPAIGQGFKTVVSYSYDAHKNVKEVVTSNYDLRQIDQEHKKTEYEYDLVSGNVNEVIYQKDYEDEYHHQYHYDANNRLVRVFTSDDHGITYEKDAKYFYYLHGTLARVELGEDEVQGIDYAYNLQGWLKGVNASTLVAKRDIGNDAADGINKHFGRDAFGFALGYYANDYTPIENITPFANTANVQAQNLNDEPTTQNGNNHSSLYNGNISHMVVAISDANEAPMDVLANNYRYDQLQRIKAMDVYHDGNVMLSNDFAAAGLYRAAGGESAYQTRYSFDKNGNLASLKRNGSGKDQNGNTIALAMDEFTYNYYETSSNTASTTTDPLESNRLSHVGDAIAASNYDTDIDPGQITANYKYDASGQLIQDLDEEIEQIKWTVTGKVKEIKFVSSSNKKDLKFVYDPMDMRVMKIQYTNDNSKNSIRTYYSYDAQGNVMATYERTILANFQGSGATSDYTDKLVLNEHMIYGASRIGMEQKHRTITTAEVNETIETTNFELGEGISWDVVTQESYDLSYRKLEDKLYELTEHRGNVMEVVTDRKLPVDDGVFDVNGNLTSTTPDDIVDYYAVNVVSYSDYYPYGGLMDGRQDQTDYRYGFQGQEKDDEVKGEGNSINYKYRMHDPRIGRFFAVDPLAPKYPHYTPYQFSGNKVIAFRELEGLEEFPAYSDYAAAYGDDAMPESSWDGSDGAWLTSDRESGDFGNGRYHNAMASITENQYIGRLEAFEQVNDYYSYIKNQLQQSGHESRWVIGASYLVKELSYLYDQGGKEQYILLATLAGGPIAGSFVKSTFRKMEPILGELNVEIADYAITQFHSLLYGSRKGKKLTGINAYWFDRQFIITEQRDRAKSVYARYNQTEALNLLNIFFNYGENNPLGGAPIPVPKGIDLRNHKANTYGKFGWKGRTDVPLMMLWPDYHQNRTLTGSFLENQFYERGLAGGSYGNSELLNNYYKLSWGLTH